MAPSQKISYSPPSVTDLTFYHSPQTRSFGAAVLLNELSVKYNLVHLDLKKGEQRKEAFLGINPLGKVPAIKHKDVVVTEQVAIFIYLADLVNKKKLAPAISDPLRGTYLRWMVFYGSSFEPAILDKALNRAPGPTSRSSYGDYGLVIEAIRVALQQGPYFLGERFSALDILWAAALRWAVSFELVPALPEMIGFIDRVTVRPSFLRAAELDEYLLNKQNVTANE